MKWVQNSVGKVGETALAIQEGHLDELENREEGEPVKAKRGKMWGGESGGRTAVLQVFVDCQAKEEETLEQMRGAMDDMIGVGHGVNFGEDFNFDGNNVDS